MKNRFAFSFAFPFAAAAAALLLAPQAARAQQIDTNPPLPNVLILLDNSGSMERMIDGTLPEDNPANACNCDPTLGTCNWSQAPQPNRWNVVQQALTGSLQNGFNCVAMPRTSGSVFAGEYQIANVPPYDTNYYLPFHRMVAQDTSGPSPVSCVVAPNALPGATTPNGVGVAGTGAGGNATDFKNAITTRPYNGPATTCKFEQLANGAINTMTDLMRFGLMTFDQDPSALTGVVTSSSPLTVANPAFTGMWSYFPGWDKGQANPYFGNPAGCVAPPVPMAVGARNPAAPPWEGRMVGFPSTNAISDQETNNGQIASVVVASRPYGATPMDGMLYGARYYFQADPTGPQQTDPYVQGGCRNEYMILLTDGAPNDDMRPGCLSTPEAGAGTCPFPLLPEEVVASLYNNGQSVGSQQFVKTYVIGFAVSTVAGDQGQSANCSTLVENAGQPAAMCDPTTLAGQNPSPALAACCKLQQIAFNGGSSQAYFADTPGDLQKALGAILADISKQATTRTTPAFSPVLTSALNANAVQVLQTSASSFLASFNPSPGLPWSGDVQRQRLACTAPEPAITPAKGDDFADNLNSGTSPRTFLAFEPGPWNGTPKADSTQTIRPFVSTGVGDNIPPYSATAVVGQAVNVLPQITPDALGIPLTGATAGCPYTPSNAPGPAYLTPAQCRDMLLDFTFGQSSFVGPNDFTFVSRGTNAFGDVFHASPVVVGPPGALLRDPSYDAFRSLWNAVPATSGRGTVATGSSTKPRDTVVYVATNDGLLHAFWADESKEENNEEWSLLPPAVMPSLLSSYPSSHQFLLDGTPVVKDVVWERSNGNLTTSGDNPWHTMLVAGFGPYQQGYYAVDVTNPDASGLVSGSNTLKPAGPVFRWQLTKMPATNYPIFAGQSAIPAITTLLMDPGDGVVREIGVAILPGGVDPGGAHSSASGGPSCARAAPSSPWAPLGIFPARSSVRCWNANQKNTDVVNGRAVTIARLDTGEILRVFARKADVMTFPGDTLLLATPSRINDTPLDSPMTGTPVVYPSDVGTSATKIFVGDADGTIWRFDVSDPNPANWSGALYLDLYNTGVDTSTTSWADGQPFQVPMVASLDTAGELVLSAATGSTETFDTSGTNYLYSITEKLQGNPPQPHAFVNWYFGPQSTPVSLRPGERVSGPMTVFNGTLYFSTYAAASSATVSCSSGSARLFGWDFVLPYASGCSSTDPLAPCDRSQGGVRELTIPPAAAPDFIDPVTQGAQAGAVIPGVSIQETPSCGSVSQSTDTYVPGGMHRQLTNVTAQSYSLFAQVGAKGAAGTNAATGQVQLPLPAPASPTVIDSWAAVLE